MSKREFHCTVNSVDYQPLFRSWAKERALLYSIREATQHNTKLN